MDLLAALLPGEVDRDFLLDAIRKRAPEGTTAVVGLSVRSLFSAIIAETSAGRPVAMSGVTIQDMATLARAHGCDVRPVDIDLGDLLPTPHDAVEACRRDAAMVVIAHLYGTRGDIAEIAAAVLRPDRLIVEDCAQAFDGALALGNGADIALYSFGPIKKATALGGAVAIFRDAALAQRVQARIAGWPTLSNRWFARRVWKFIGLKLLNIPWVCALFLKCLAATGRNSETVIGRMARGFSGSASITQAVQQQPPGRLLWLLDRRLRRWQPPPDATPNLLQRLSERFPVPGLAAQPTHWWLAPILARDPEPLIEALRRDGFDATRGTTSMRAIANRQGIAGDNAALLIGKVVYLPKPRSVREAETLAQAVERAAG